MTQHGTVHQWPESSGNNRNVSTRKDKDCEPGKSGRNCLFAQNSGRKGGAAVNSPLHPTKISQPFNWHGESTAKNVFGHSKCQRQRPVLPLSSETCFQCVEDEHVHQAPSQNLQKPTPGCSSFTLLVALFLVSETDLGNVVLDCDCICAGNACHLSSSVERNEIWNKCQQNTSSERQQKKSTLLNKPIIPTMNSSVRETRATISSLVLSETALCNKTCKQN